MDGRGWVTLAPRTTEGDVQRTEFTGLGRYLRIVATHHVGPVRIAGVQVLGSR